MDIKKKYLYVLVLSIVSAVVLTACDREASGQGTGDALSVEDEVTEDTVSEKAVQEYSITETSIDDSTNAADSEYEISDMLPRPSDDTFIMSVDEAMKLMGKNPDGTDIEDE